MNEPALVSNPFGKGVATSANNAVANSDAERAIQEVQAALIIAKKFPRNPIEAVDRIINACSRESLANTALYCYPRGGQEVTGPSIRLAEALAQEWGNIQFGIRELSSENGVSSVEAFAWDVQSNTKQVKNFQVPHQRYAKGQLKKLTDPRDIYEMIANQGARRMRACILGVIPGDVVEVAVNQCEKTQQTHVDVTPEAIKKMLEAFKDNYGVGQELIEKRIGKRAESINASQMLNLRNIYASLKDGMSKPGDWFDVGEVVETDQPKVSDIATTAKKPEKQSQEPEPEFSKDHEKLVQIILDTKKAEEVEQLKNSSLIKKMPKHERDSIVQKIDDRLKAFKALED